MLIPLDELAAQAAAGTLRVQVGKVCKLDDMAHRCMEENEAGSKIVVLTSFEGPTADSPACLAKPYSRPACVKTSITDGRVCAKVA